MAKSHFHAAVDNVRGAAAAGPGDTPGLSGHRRPAGGGALLHFQMACCLAYAAKEGALLTDATAPAGVVIPPADPLITPVMHAFAKALLCLEDDCPAEWPCRCNDIRRRYNAPPPDHAQATDTLDTSKIRALIEEQRRSDVRPYDRRGDGRERHHTPRPLRGAAPEWDGKGER